MKMKDLYTEYEFDDIPRDARVAIVRFGGTKRKPGKVFYCTTRRALEELSKKYGSYQAEIVREGKAPWNSEKQGFI